MADLKAKVLKQVEFYFSDSNYPKDKFLLAEAKKDADNFVPVSTLLKFKRLAALSEDPELILEALKESTKLEIDTTKKAVRRVDPLPENDVSTPRTIYAKGFDPKTLTIDVAKEFFSKFGTVLCVRTRKYRDNTLKPSVFVEFSTEDEAKKVIAENPTLPFDTKDNAIKSAQDFLAEKGLKSMDQRKSKAEIKAENMAKMEAEAEAEAKEFAAKGEFEKGLLLKFEGVGDGVSREDLQAAFGEYGDIQFVDFGRGKKDGFLRFKEVGSAEKALSFDKLIGGEKVKLTLLEGEVEANYWQTVLYNKELNRLRTQKGLKTGKRGPPNRGGRGGRGRGRGRGGKRQRS